MDLRASDEQQQLRDTLRRLFDRRMAELVDALPEPPHHDAARDLADGIRVGLLGLGLPEEYGGAGTFSDLVAAHDELGRGLAGPVLPAIGVAGRLVLHATGSGRDALLTALAAGESTATAAFTDAGGGCRRVMAGPEVSRVLIADCWSPASDSVVRVVETATTGLEWRAEPNTCDLPSSTLLVRDDLMADTQLLLDDRGGQLLRTEVTILAAARQLGGARAVVERTVAHVKTREQFDRPIGSFQAVQHQLADASTDLAAAELAIAQAAWAIEAAIPPIESRRLADIAALAAASTFRGTTLIAHQLHGGMGFVLDSPLHLWSARAIGDPSVPSSRRDLLDDLALVSGITADGVTAPPDQRLSRD